MIVVAKEWKRLDLSDSATNVVTIQLTGKEFHDYTEGIMPKDTLIGAILMELGLANEKEMMSGRWVLENEQF